MTPAGQRVLRSGLATGVAAAILIGLGAWQLERLSWKNGLIALVAQRMAADPAPVPPKPEWAGLDVSAWSYRRVRATGTFDAGAQARVYAVLSDEKGPYGGPGYWIMAPLALKDGGVVVVNRGFAPEGRAELATLAPPAGEVTVTGTLREPETRNLFTPADEPDKRLFFARDPATIAGGLGVADAAPFTIDEDAAPTAGALPQGGETRVAFPNRHLEYALTWFGLAGALVAVFLAFAWRTVRTARD